MKRIFKSIFWLFLLIVLLGGIASLFPLTEGIRESLPLWVLYPMRICAGIFLTFMFVGFLVDSGILQRLFGKK